MLVGLNLRKWRGQNLNCRAIPRESRVCRDNRRHFFAAAAEAMRRILIESARRKKRQMHSGEFARVELNEFALGVSIPNEQLLEINESLDRLAAKDAQAIELIKLRFTRRRRLYAGGIRKRRHSRHRARDRHNTTSCRAPERPRDYS